MSQCSIKRNKGFTLLELLVALTIFMLVGSLVLAPLADFRDRQLVEMGAENIMSLMAQARTDTLASLNDSNYGVYFESGRMVLFMGTTFSEPNINNVEVSFDSRVELSDISLFGGGFSVVFDRLTGETNNYGTLKLEVVRNASTTQTVTLYATCSMEKN